MKKIINFLKKNNIKNIDKKIDLLNTYKKLLIIESKEQNLISKNTINSIEITHFLDSAFILKYFNFKNKKVVDVGSGAGFPGIILKILCDSMSITLIEPRRKRCLFLEKVIKVLDLKECFVINSKCQNVNEKFDFVISRAVSQTYKMLNWTKHLLNENGYVVLYKTENYIKEVNFPVNKEFDSIYYNIEKKELRRVLLSFKNKN